MCACCPEPTGLHPVIGLDLFLKPTCRSDLISAPGKRSAGAGEIEEEGQGNQEAAEWGLLVDVMHVFMYVEGNRNNSCCCKAFVIPSV